MVNSLLMENLEKENKDRYQRELKKPTVPFLIENLEAYTGIYATSLFDDVKVSGPDNLNPGQVIPF